MKPVLIALALLVYSPLSTGQSLPEALDSVMRREVSDRSTGCALLVVQDGRLIFDKGYGLANLETKTPVSPETNFRMASVSKQFTATAILLLEKRGKLSVDDKLLTFFPDFNPNVGRRVSLRHLLTHTSGLVDYEALLPPTQKAQIFDEDVLNLVKSQDSTYFEPGSRFRYSNTAFCLLAQIVEKVSGSPYSVFLQERIFKPAGMRQTTLYEPKRNIPNRAMGYARNKEGSVYFSDQSTTSGTRGDGCVYTSLVDYRKWIEKLTRDELVDLPKQLARMHHSIEGRKTDSYGLGWFLIRRRGEPEVLFHSGSTCGFNNFVVWAPQKKTMVVCFSNIADNESLFLKVYGLVSKPAGLPPSSLIQELHRLTR